MELHYTGLLARWFREMSPPAVHMGNQDLNTNEFNVWYQVTSSKVNVECSHLKSEWGLVDEADAWTPYLQLSFKEPRPLWAKFTVEVKPSSNKAVVNAGAGTGAPPAVGVPAGGPVVDNRPCFTPTHICPTKLCCGVSRTDSKTKGATFSPAAGAAGGTASAGNVTYTVTRNYNDVVETIWTINGNTEMCDGSSFHRRAYWELKATKRWSTIPDQLRVGLIVKHKRDPFLFSVRIEGGIRQPLLGELKFWGETYPFTVGEGELPRIPNDFTGWATKMCNRMAELKYDPIDMGNTIIVSAYE